MKEYWTIKDANSGFRVRPNGYVHGVELWGLVPSEWKKYTSRLRALEDLLIAQKQWPSSKKVVLVHHKVKTKPRGAKVGTWAWACEQMATGSVVWKCAHQTRYYIDGYGNMLEFSPTSPKPAIVTKQMIRATSWGRVP